MVGGRDGGATHSGTYEDMATGLPGGPFSL